MGVLPVVVSIGVLLAGAGVALLHTRARGKARTHAARSLGLTAAGEDFVGTHHGRAILLAEDGLVDVRLTGALASAGVGIIADGADPDTRTGDPHFDDEHRILGPTDHVAGLLDAAARAAVDAFGGRLQLSDGQLHWRSSGTSTELVERINALVDLAERLEERATIPGADRLAELAGTDKDRAVRLRSARWLLDWAPDSDAARRFMKEASASEDPASRLLVAQLEGHDAVTDAIAVLIDGWAEPKVRAAAAALIQESGHFDAELETLLQNLLASATGELLRAILGIYAAQQSCPPVWLAHSRSLCVNVADRCVWIGVMRFSPYDGAVTSLVKSLRDPHEDVIVAAAESLGEMGNPSVLEELIRVAEGSGRRRVQRAARIAADRIRDVNDAARGGLQLVDGGASDGEGGLALSRHPRSGRVFGREETE